MFFDTAQAQAAISISAQELDFGSCSRLSPANHHTLTVTNTTAAKVTAFLSVPTWQGYGSQAQPQQVFQVGFCHLPPFTTCSWKQVW